MTGPAIVSCAGDTELAKRLYGFLFSSFPSAASSEAIALGEDEVAIDTKLLGINNDDVRKSLSEFRAQNKDIDGYVLSELGDIFTIGIQQSLDKVILSCEMCGYLSHSEDELGIHKRMHALLHLM